MDEIFSRNILIDKIQQKGQKKLNEAKILVAGLGGLGSGVVANLASIGIGTLGLLDCDKIEKSNLNRQFIHKYCDIGVNKTKSAQNWVKNYHPEIQTCTYNLKLDENNYENIFQNYDIIVDCFYSYVSKFLLNQIAIKHNKILIHGGVSEFQGQVTTIVPKQTPCLNCLFEDIKNLNEYEIKGIVSPIINIIASIQASEVMKIVLNFDNILKGKLLTFNLLNYKLNILNFEKNKHCKVCSQD